MTAAGGAMLRLSKIGRAPWRNLSPVGALNTERCTRSAMDPGLGPAGTVDEPASGGAAGGIGAMLCAPLDPVSSRRLERRPDRISSQ
jgi:hypothetical protein